MKPFQNRIEAGRLLATKLADFASREDVLVLALPRGGVPVGSEIAKALHAELDVLMVRKLGVPSQPELAMGAIAAGGVRILDREIVRALGITPTEIESAMNAETRLLESREALYRAGRPAPSIQGRTVILADDGMATGSTMRAAIAAVNKQRPGNLIVAVPVAALSTVQDLKTEGQEVVCLHALEPYGAVGAWYEDFSQISDAEVIQLLESHQQHRRVTPA